MICLALKLNVIANSVLDIQIVQIQFVIIIAGFCFEIDAFCIVVSLILVQRAFFHNFSLF